MLRSAFCIVIEIGFKLQAAIYQEEVSHRV